MTWSDDILLTGMQAAGTALDSFSSRLLREVKTEEEERYIKWLAVGILVGMYTFTCIVYVSLSDTLVQVVLIPPMAPSFHSSSAWSTTLKHRRRHKRRLTPSLAITGFLHLMTDLIYHMSTLS